MTKVVKVTRAQARAARLRVRSDKERGLTPDPRMVRIADAVHVSASDTAHATESASVEVKPNGLAAALARVKEGLSDKERAVLDTASAQTRMGGPDVHAIAKALGMSTDEVESILVRIDRAYDSDAAELRQAK